MAQYWRESAWPDFHQALPGTRTLSSEALVRLWTGIVDIAEVARYPLDALVEGPITRPRR